MLIHLNILNAKKKILEGVGLLCYKGRISGFQLPSVLHYMIIVSDIFYKRNLKVTNTGFQFVVSVLQNGGITLKNYAQKFTFSYYLLGIIECIDLLYILKGNVVCV